MRTKIVTLLLVLVATFALAACGGDDSSSDSDSGDTTSEQSDDSATDAGDDGSDDEGSTSGGGQVLELGVNGNELEFDKTELEATAGEVTLKLTNSSSIPHNVAIESEDGEELDAGEIVGEGEVSEATAELEPGTYEFVCTPHEGAGMVGTLTVT